ncbi:hypothetical protein FKE98_12430 [Corynebacterium aurimucosum]|uniref:ATP-dependent nuclease n=1 Tax=Corynebacterium guaraldiae TaxID=3051103 RepID=UPI0012B8B326|nr:AAA family ATPase [Corynebacterium guaraldiae]MTE11145.1 hypothetical protein [Corynebacterium guaraldiae]
MKTEGKSGLVKPAISKINIGDEEISIKTGSVTVLVGPNNSGKSHFLDQLEAQLAGADSAFSKCNDGLISGVEVRWQGQGDLSEETCLLWANQNLTIVPTGFYEVSVPKHFSSSLGSFGSYLDPDEVKTIFLETSILGKLVGYFVRRDGPLTRVQESFLKDLKEDSLAKRVWHDSEALAKVTKYFKEVFGEPLSVYDIGEGTIGYKIALPSEKMPRIDESFPFAQRAEMDRHPKVWQQGLGMQSVLGILLGLFADDRPIVLLDEPEAFLHPPQALRLGQILREVAEEEGRQIFCATHDKNLLSGLADGEKDTLSIIRLKRNAKSARNSSFGFSLIPSTFNRDIRSRSRIRHTHLLDGLFSDAVIIVENEKDAFFFSEALGALPKELTSGLQPSSICFVGVGGKNNIPSTFELLRSLKTPTVIIADTDFIVSDKYDHSGGPFIKVLEEVSAHNKNDIVSARNAIENLILSDAGRKDEGGRKRLLNKKLTQLYRNRPLWERVGQLNASLEGIPLCLVPGGELEDLDREIGGHGTDWVWNAINQQSFANEATEGFMGKVLGKVVNQIVSGT